MLHNYPENLRKLRYLKAEIKDEERDFPGSPVVKTLPSNAGGANSIPDQGIKVPHAFRPKKKALTTTQCLQRKQKPQQGHKSLGLVQEPPALLCQTRGNPRFCGASEVPRTWGPKLYTLVLPERVGV